MRRPMWACRGRYCIPWERNHGSRSRNVRSSGRTLSGKPLLTGAPKGPGVNHSNNTNKMAFSYTAGKPEERAEFFVPAGKYSLRVVEAKADTSKGGNDMIKLKLRVINTDGTLSVSLFDYLVFTKDAFFKIDQFLMSAGKHPGEGAQFDFEDKIDDLIGWEVEADLVVETFNDKKQNKVAAYLFDEFD